MKNKDLQSNVNYSYFPSQKAVFVPLTTKKPEENVLSPPGTSDEAVQCEDFTVFGGSPLSEPVAKTSMSLFRDAEFLYLDISCFEPGESIAAEVAENNMMIWQDDIIEMHFGSLAPDPWLLQLCVCAGGGRFDSSGEYTSWTADVSVGSNYWRAAIKVPMDRLPAVNGGINFNLCRKSTASGEYSVWAPLKKRFHEVENFGTLLFCGYSTAFFLRTNRTPKKPLSRPEYEKLISQFMVRAETVVHGPYLSNPAPDSICISWATAGKLPGLIEYRRKGDKNFTMLPTDESSGILLHRELHFAELAGIRPDTEYEYRLISLSPVLNTPARSKEIYSFKTLSRKQTEFTFVCWSDIHSNVGQLQKMLCHTEASRADFFVVLGDSLSHMAGKSAIFDGLLDPASEKFAARKPLVFVRGNHEQLGVFAGEYFNCMKHPSGKTYYTFRHGSVFFIVLDFGNDSPDGDSLFFKNEQMLREQRRWLGTVISSKPYIAADFRIVLVHIPPCRKTAPTEAAGHEIISGILDSADPAKRIHLMLSGHIHDYIRMNPGEKHPAVTTNKLYNTFPVFSHPFTTVANKNTALFEVKISKDLISCRAVEPDGKTLDSFAIGEDGRLKEENIS